MVEQSLNERRQLLQTKIFAHPSVNGFNPYSQAVLSRLSRCHTAGIGVHHYRCSNEACGHLHCQYHSCGNRHCPCCGGMKREQWVEDRMGELLPTTYFHLVFIPIAIGTAGAKGFVHGQQETAVWFTL